VIRIEENVRELRAAFDVPEFNNRAAQKVNDA